MNNDVRTIPLSKGLVALVDAADYEQLRGFKWHASETGAGYYARRHGKREDGTRVVVYMHRQLLPAVGAEVDHVDGNTLDNRRGNLRMATHRENSCNSRGRRKDSSLPKGVWFVTAKSKWSSQIRDGGRSIHLGYFSSVAEAHAAYIAAAHKHYGDFARVAA